MTTEEFTCAECGGTFPKARSDEEAAAEAGRDFPGLADPVIVCDDCYQELREEREQDGLPWGWGS